MQSLLNRMEFVLEIKGNGKVEIVVGNGEIRKAKSANNGAKGTTTHVSRIECVHFENSNYKLCCMLCSGRSGGFIDKSAARLSLYDHSSQSLSE